MAQKAKASYLPEDSSPRSTILLASDRMTTALPVGMNDTNVVAPDVSPVEDKLPTPVTANEGPTDAPGLEGKDAPKTGSSHKSTSEKGQVSPPNTVPSEYPVQGQGYPTLTPQTSGGYYLGYPQLQPHQTQMTPEPGSPAPSHHPVYDVANSFFQPHSGAAFHPTPANSFLGATGSVVPGAVPLSPPRNNNGMSGGAPPASPLFPRAVSGGESAPNLPYMLSPQLGTPPYTAGVSSHSSGEEGGGAWGGAGERNQNMYQLSPQVQMPYGSMPVSRAAAGIRAPSFEDSMLPPSAIPVDDPANPLYSPYGGSQTSAGGATVFSHQPWYPGGPPDPYGTPGSPLQPRPTAHLGMYPGMGGGPGGGGGMRGPMGPYGQYYPASSPGPPIQTTASNKGPDGANLFIFHIPNHFTNLDMYQLFTPYGNLLSVRIMVEKDTGRSRGFGFVSYDSPESAALAIKELNGFPIGNKRLKVQHKQIRRQDMRDHEADGGFGRDGGFPRMPASALPPSGPGAAQNLWFDTAAHSGAGSDDPTLTTQEDGVGGGALEGDSPLGNLGPLQSALPDIPANAPAE